MLSLGVLQDAYARNHVVKLECPNIFVIELQQDFLSHALGTWCRRWTSPTLHVHKRGGKDVTTFNWLLRRVVSCLIHLSLFISEFSEVLEHKMVAGISIFSLSSILLLFR